MLSFIWYFTDILSSILCSPHTLIHCLLPDSLHVSLSNPELSPKLQALLSKGLQEIALWMSLRHFNINLFQMRIIHSIPQLLFLYSNLSVKEVWPSRTLVVLLNFHATITSPYFWSNIVDWIIVGICVPAKIPTELHYNKGILKEA